MFPQNILPQHTIAFVAFCFIAIAGGCGNGDFQTAKVTGVVTCKGEPISNATIVFTPVPIAGKSLIGKPATGAVEADGSFQLTTYKHQDGAVIGKHRVAVTFAGQELADLVREDDEFQDVVPRARRRAKLPPCANSNKQIEVEVKSGENHFDISLSDS
ncbi:hypothetical protein Pan97_29130 [Bremerella volcania]|uniref:Carboxypeptidase regulatory-like domain-containing protein n=1 Tax=Bremerella volcania TaxID=2527984 RepID=A0A518C9I2_9BACT|nr:hypothetical protein [Bremerella volcania]QDU75871.1 hypothetical protein Pan97_29130 [Bremerella volcania]